jgi:hypothetical protein
MIGSSEMGSSDFNARLYSRPAEMANRLLPKSGAVKSLIPGQVVHVTREPSYVKAIL